jgi:hypothetical protein
MAAEYVVKNISERARLAGDGSIEKLYKVEAVTAGGTHFSLELTEAQTDPKQAAVILKAKAKQLDAIRES